MFAAVQHNLVLWLGAKTGLTVGVLIFSAMAFLAAAVAFLFLCVTGLGRFARRAAGSGSASPRGHR